LQIRVETAGGNWYNSCSLDFHEKKRLPPFPLRDRIFSSEAELFRRTG
jgi:hypothetical protein